MKIFKKFIISILLFFWLVLSNTYVHWEYIDWLNNINPKNYKTKITEKEKLSDVAKDTWFKLINWVRTIFSFILVIFIVYAWIQMVMSTWTNDEDLSSAKRTLWYSIVWIIFINFPVEIYKSINWVWSSNLFIDELAFRQILKNILFATQILIWWIALFILILEWIKLIANSKTEDAFTKAKLKVRWVLLALIFLWFIELWIRFLITWDQTIITWNGGLFQSLANLALYISWPIALFFLTLAWYYYIFSNWDEEKMKKWKNIIINTSIWVIILLCIYVLLNDLSLLKF